MTRFELDITLLEDCVLSERTATQGAHRTLDYIPGSALLGAVAARLYRELGDDAFEWFHSGRVRFGDGLPVVDGQVARPMPLCWFGRKGAPLGRPVRAGVTAIDPDAIRNFQYADRFEDGVQPRQLRDGHVTGDGLAVHAVQSYSQKTAVSIETGSAEAGQLFGYSAIAAGQSFRAEVGVDEGLATAVGERLAVVCGKSMVIGRSRGAEYGRVEIAIREAGDDVAAPPPGTRITLWLQSDMALVGADGLPTLEPTPEALGLPPGHVDWTLTFLRTRRLAHWNAYRGARDAEEVVLVRGSVIGLELDQQPDEQQLKLLAAGVGRRREIGWGRVLLNPTLLSDQIPKFSGRAAATPERTRPASEPRAEDSQLIAWLRRTATDDHAADHVATELLAEIRKAYSSARKLSGDKSAGPSASQWGTVYAIARAAKAEGDGLDKQLKSVCKENGEGWQDRVFLNKQAEPFGRWFLALIRDKKVAVIRALAHKAMALAEVRE